MWRRMLPEDIRACFRLSDMFDVCHESGFASRMEDFLVALLLNDQMWGAVVESPGIEGPVCFGSCIFISDSLARRVLSGHHPFLFLDLCEDRRLRTHILDFSQVEQDSKHGKLNFYGGLFCFARTNNPIRFIAEMDNLQKGLVVSMSGFGLGRYFKQTYEPRVIARTFKNVAMRKRFGADLASTYEGSTDDRVNKHHPCLFTSTKREASSKLGMPICQLMCPGEAVLDFSFQSRMLLRLEAEGLSKSQIECSLIKGKGTSKSNWDTVKSQLRRNQLVADFLGVHEEEARIRERLRDYIRNHPQELGVLPQLTPIEKQTWLATHPAPARPESVVSLTPNLSQA